MQKQGEQRRGKAGAKAGVKGGRDGMGTRQGCLTRLPGKYRHPNPPSLSLSQLCHCPCPMYCVHTPNGSVQGLTGSEGIEIKARREEG